MSILYDLPSNDYFAADAFGSTSIRHLSDPEISLQEVKYLLDHDEHKPAYDTGTLAHSLILESSLDHLIVEIPYKTYHSEKAQVMRDEAYAKGLIPLKESEIEETLDQLNNMRDAVLAHPIAKDLLTDHDPEVSIFWEQDDVPMKARIDALHESKGIAVDLKTIRSARPNDVRKQISDLGYYIQQRHYLNGLKAVTGFDMDWYFVTVGKEAPHPVSVHKMSPDALEQAQARIEYAIARYKQAQEHGWTGYTAVYEQQLTPWERTKNEELLEEIA